MTLTDLNSAWQSLRTAALGRSGFEQNVSPELATRFTLAYAGWLQWYGTAGVTPELFGSANPEALAWIKRYRDLAFDMKREGVAVPDFVETAGEQISDAAGSIGQAVVGIVAVVGLGWLWLNRKKRS